MKEEGCEWYIAELSLHSGLIVYAGRTTARRCPPAS
jgi:hypothetical protein